MILFVDGRIVFEMRLTDVHFVCGRFDIVQKIFLVGVRGVFYTIPPRVRSHDVFPAKMKQTGNFDELIKNPPSYTYYLV